MALKNFIKENFVLVVGLTLPVLLVIAFLIANALHGSMGPPPQYEMLFETTRYDGSPQPYSVDFSVKKNVLEARIWKHNVPTANIRKKLMVYDGKTQSVRELTYDMPNLDTTGPTEVVLNEFKNIKVDSSTKAPDGYEFDRGGYNGNGGIVTDIFGGGYGSYTARVTKDGSSYKIPDNGNRYYSYDIEFLGWIIQK